MGFLLFTLTSSIAQIAEQLKTPGSFFFFLFFFSIFKEDMGPIFLLISAFIPFACPK